jgi:hypothetical protein
LRIAALLQGFLIAAPPAVALTRHRFQSLQFSDETEADIRALIERDFGRLPSGADARRAFLDWLHYRARLIPQRPREVVASKYVLEKRATYPAIDRIRSELERGGDVSPWLSERVRRRKTDPKADLMFNDWKISHFHLGQFFECRNKIKRTANGDLLFAHVRGDRAVLLDVQPHGSWAMRHLLEVLLEVSPADLPEMKGILGTESGGLTDEQIFKLRQNGYTAPIQIGRRVFMAPGLGISSSKHATRLVRYADQLARQLRHIDVLLKENRLPPLLLSQLSNTIGIPVRLGIRLHAGNLIIYEKSRGIDLSVFAPLE